MVHCVNLEVFEGPIELLLYLVREAELDIAEIPIAQITDQYLSSLQSEVRLDMTGAAEFLLMAAVLIRMKLRRLLPRPQAEDLDTSRTVSMDDIVAEFRRYQQAARLLLGWQERRRELFPRAGVSRPTLALDGSVLHLSRAFQTVVSRLAPGDDFVVEPVRLRIEERLAQLRALLATQHLVHFSEYLSALPTMGEVIITFLAALELARTGELRVSQNEADDAIYLFQARGHDTESCPPPAPLTYS